MQYEKNTLYCLLYSCGICLNISVTQQQGLWNPALLACLMSINSIIHQNMMRLVIKGHNSYMTCHICIHYLSSPLSKLVPGKKCAPQNTTIQPLEITPLPVLWNYKKTHCRSMWCQLQYSRIIQHLSVADSQNWWWWFLATMYPMSSAHSFRLYIGGQGACQRPNRSAWALASGSKSTLVADMSP